jgi:hypothetical protein
METPFNLIKFSSTLRIVKQETIDQFKDIFPEFVIEEWNTRGLASYMDGLLITTDPNDFYDVVEDWGIPDPQNCHVLMRTAFGSFYYKYKDNYYDKSIVHNLPIGDLRKRFDFVLKFSLTDKDVLKDNLYKDIYDKAVKRLGPPLYDEVYAFVPAIALGGDYNPDTIQKVKLKEHLAFLSQL